MSGPPPDTEPAGQAVPPPVFLERHSYRRRRLTDAARLLPILGAAMFAVPLLWPSAGDGGAADPMPTSSAILYIFTAWVLLILASLWFGFRTRGWNRMEREAHPGTGEDAGEGG